MSEIPTSSTTLRPLGLGELLDRAVNLSVKYLVPFALIYAVVEIPIAVVQFVWFGPQSGAMSSLLTVFSRQAAGGKAMDPFTMRQLSAQLLPQAGGLTLMTLLLYPLSKAALVEATTTAYLRGAVDFKSAYRVAFARWLPLLGVVGLYIACGIGVYLVVFVLVFLAAFVLGAITVGLHTLGTAIAIVLGVAVAIALFLFFLVAGLAFEVSVFTSVLEHASPARSLAAGIRRVFRGVGLRRSLVVGLAYLAVILAIGLISAAGAMVLAGLARSVLVNALFSTLVGLATAAFVTSFMGIFYFDLRVREEGLDLELAARQLASGAPASG